MEEVFDLLSRTADGVFAVDRDQRIAFWNDAAAGILGFDSADVVGRHCHEIIGGVDESGRVFCRTQCPVFRASVAGHFHPSADLQVRTKSGESARVNVTTLLLPSRWRDLSLLVHIFREVDRARQAQESMDEILRKIVLPEESQPDPFPDDFDELTDREGQVLRMLAAGASTEALCSELQISRATARTHVQRVLGKLRVHSRLEAVTLALRNGAI